MRKWQVVLAAACLLSACDRRGSLYLEPGKDARPAAAKPSQKPSPAAQSAPPARSEPAQAPAP
jgi:hypothetical protein